jgi:hypothetical protein
MTGSGQILAFRHIPVEAVLAPEFPRHALETFITLKPFLDYLNAFVD